MLPPLQKHQKNVTAVCDGNSNSEKESDDDYTDRKNGTPMTNPRHKGFVVQDHAHPLKKATRSQTHVSGVKHVEKPVMCREKTASHGGHVMDVGQ